MTTPLLGPSSSGFRGVIGVAREDITPPVGIYARSWGAATHDAAQGVHRPLLLTCITFQSSPNEPPLVLIGADLGWWRSRDDEWSVRGAVLAAISSLDESRLMFCLSHTHAGPSLQRENADRPGGHLIESYQAKLRDAAIRAARRAMESRRTATLSWRYGACDLATNRDLPEPNGKRIVCGFSPASPADDTLLVGRVSGADGHTIATIVNYACHPTTLAWENKLLSPDYIGAMRETIEAETNAPCLFMQGASGELAPAEQYVGDTGIADRHGRRVGFAVLSTLEAMDRPGGRLAYQGVVESGAPLAVWRQVEQPASAVIAAQRVLVPLRLKPLPSIAELEAKWRDCNDPVLKERLWRKRGVRKVVGDGDVTEMPLWIWRLGDAMLVGQPNEPYSRLQIDLRRTFRDRAVAVMNLVNGSAGYLPPRELYEQDIYQVWQSPYAAGALEILIDGAEKSIAELIA
jgi:hypothetical protein